MKKILLLAVVLGLLSSSDIYAKRAAPGKVESVVGGKIEYRAPNDQYFAASGLQMGYVEAWEGTTLIWRRQIYVVKYIVNLEKDIQDVFIKALELKGNTILVKNDRGSEYELNIETLDVKVVKGSLVEAREVLSK